ncbi:hypothetical protein MP638_005069, partial [Amoeboaphelidium occidentale]
MTDLRIITCNVQSMRIPSNQVKLDAISDFLQQKSELDESIDFLLLNETWTNQYKEIKYHFKNPENISEKYDIIYDSNTTDLPLETFNGNGALIICKSEWSKYIQKKYSYPGRIIAIQLKIKDKCILLMNVYLPPLSTVSSSEYKKIVRHLKKIIHEQTDQTFIICGGDWNLAMNPHNDRLTASNSNEHEQPNQTNPEHKFLKKLTQSNNPNALVDIWRLMHLNSHEYSHSKNRGTKFPSRSRIDFFLISQNLISKTLDADIIRIPFVDSDHLPVYIYIRIDLQRSRTELTNLSKTRIILEDKVSDDHKRKFNDSLKNDLESFIHNEDLDSIVAIFQESLIKHAHSDLPTKKIFTTGTKKVVRRNSRKKLKREYNDAVFIKHQFNEIKELSPITNVMLLNLEGKLSNDPDIRFRAPENRIDSILTTIKKKRRNIRKEDIQRFMKIRESMFFHETKRHINSILDKGSDFDGIQFLKDDTGGIITEPNEIKSKLNEYYSSIYSNNHGDQYEIHPSFTNEIKPKDDINAEWYEAATAPIDTNYLREYLKTLPNKSSPGLSGIPYDILKLINEETVLKILAKVINLSIQECHLPESLRKGKIILLPKINNWQGELDKLRPITLLETFQKLISGIITTRITKIIDEHNILKGFNFGFRTGCGTNDVLISLRTIIDDANHNKLALFIASLDIMKAFDSVPTE